MARVSTYLNFPRTTEAAFLFYKSVFGTEFTAPIARFRDIPASPDQPPLAEGDKDLVMHVELPILGGHVLMGTDAPESMGFSVTPGNNVYINLEPDTRAEARRLVDAARRRGFDRDAAAGDVLGRVFREFRGPVRNTLDAQLRQQVLSGAEGNACDGLPWRIRSILVGSCGRRRCRLTTDPRSFTLGLK